MDDFTKGIVISFAIPLVIFSPIIWWIACEAWETLCFWLHEQFHTTDNSDWRM